MTSLSTRKSFLISIKNFSANNFPAEAPSLKALSNFLRTCAQQPTRVTSGKLHIAL
jgi:hypothetical protein